MINLSSPNTPGLRALQQKSHLTAIVDGVYEELDELEKDLLQREKGRVSQREGGRGSQPEIEKNEEGTEGESSLSPSPTAFPVSSPPLYLNQTRKRPLLFVKIAVRCGRAYLCSWRLCVDRL